MGESNLYLVTGSDEARVVSESQRLFRKYAGDNPDPFSAEIYEENENVESSDLVNQVTRSLKTPSLLGGMQPKVIWLKHFSAFDKEGDKKSSTADAVAIRGLVAALKDGLSDDTILIMDGAGIDKRKPLFKCIAEHGAVVELNKPDMASNGWEDEMKACIRAVAAEKGVRLSPEAESYLLDVLGVDTARIDAELEKIICFRGRTDGVIDLNDVMPVCVGKGEEMSWALSDMLGKRDIREALRVVDVLIAQNHGNESYAFSMLFAAAKFFSQAIRIHVFMAENRIKTPVALNTAVTRMSQADKEAAVKRGMDFVKFKGYRVQHMAADATRYSPQEVIHALKVFRDAIWQCTSSGSSSRMILENALLEVIGAGGNVRYR